MILRKSALLFLLIPLFILPTVVWADSLAPGHYLLGDHPDGGATDPLYGLRLDGLYTGDDGDIYTFSFEQGGAQMEMWIDENSILIQGQVYGGFKADGASTWTDPSLYTVHFEYFGYGFAPGDDDVITQSGSGWIQKEGESQIVLEAYAGSFDYTFRFGDEDNDLGHRDFAGLSGWGWLNHSGWEHKSASDWIFTAQSVPEPSTLLLLSTGLLVGAAFRKRLH